MMEGLFVILLAFSLVFILIAIGLHLLGSYGLYRLALNQGIDNPWLAWIPVTNMYILGMIIGKMSVFKFKIESPEWVLPMIYLGAMFFSGDKFFGPIAGLVLIIVNAFAINALFKKYKPESATIYTILSLIIVFIAPILIFTIRDNEPVQ